MMTNYIKEAHSKLTEGNLAAAIKIYTQACEKYPEFAWYHYNLAKLLQDVGQIEEAIALYQRAIELKPNHFWSYFNLGKAFHHLEKWDEAVDAYRQAITLDKNQLECVYEYLGDALSRRSQLEEVETNADIDDWLEKAANYFQAKQWDDAIAFYQKVVTTNPDVGKSVYQRLGIALAAVKVKSPTPKMSADDYYKVAGEYYQQGKLDEAISYYQKAIELNPNSAVSYRALGDIYKRQNLLTEAFASYKKSVELKPDYCHAYQRLADVLHKQGKLDQAISACRTCLKIKPNQPEIEQKLQELLQEIGQTAIPAANSPDEYYKMGEDYYKKGELDQALAAHQKAIALNPNLALSYRALGDIFSRKNKPTEAVESYRKSVKLKPDYYYGYQKLANALQNQQDYQGAIAAYRRALEIQPRQVDLQEKLKALLKQENLLPPPKEYNPQDYPRVLVVAPIKFNQQAGGGVTMGNLFRGWPQDAIAQIHSDMFTEADYSVCSQYFYLPPIRNQQPNSLEIPLKQEMLEWCRGFKPDIIFARPIDNPPFYWWLPQELSKELGIPYVTNIMDDWPARYEAREDTGVWKLLLQGSLQSMFDGAAANIGISPQMCQAYEQRYRNQFVPFHNCIDVEEWSKINKSYDIQGEFSLLYLGVVTEDKELWSLKDIRDTVLALREQGYSINMRIYSAPFCQSTIRKHLEHHPGVEYAGYVHPSQLPKILSEADLLVLPINFDEASLKYVGYSIQTKVPEYMASGTPVLAYGPLISPNISYATRDNWGLVVDKPDKTMLERAIISVIQDKGLRSQLGEYARSLAFRNHDAKTIRESYRQLLASAAFSS